MKFFLSSRDPKCRSKSGEEEEQNDKQGMTINQLCRKFLREDLGLWLVVKILLVLPEFDIGLPGLESRLCSWSQHPVNVRSRGRRCDSSISLCHTQGRPLFFTDFPFLWSGPLPKEQAFERRTSKWRLMCNSLCFSVVWINNNSIKLNIFFFS